MPVAPAEGARLQWFWWGLTAQTGEFAALGGDRQINYHVGPIADAVARGDRLTRDRLVLAAKAVSLLASLGGLGSLLAAMTVNADTGRDAVELLLSVPDVCRPRAGLLEKARSIRGGTVFWGTAEQEAEAGAEKDGRVLGLAARVMPMLIAVEAAQFLDRITIRLLRALAREPQSAGLIVLLVDSDQPSDGKSAGPGEMLGDWLRSAERAQRLTRIRLDRLPDQELTEIAIRELGAGLDPVMLARVLEYAAGVPGMLYELLDEPAVAGALSGGGEGPADLAAIPKLKGVRNALEDAPLIRHALAVASVHGMRTVREWLASPSPSNGALTPASDLSGMRGAIDEAIGSGWLRQRPGTQIVEFASPQLLQVCRTEQAREDRAVIRAAREALLSAVVAAHADHSWDDLDWDVRESLLVSVVEKDPDASLVDAAHAELAAELFALRRATGRDATTGELLAAVTDQLAAQLAPPGVLIVATAEALFDAGRQDKAFQLLGDEYARLQRQFGDADTRTLSALHTLAAAYAAAAAAAHGRPEAGPLYQEALTLYKKLLDHRLTALQAAASEELLAHRLGVLDPDHPRMLVISTRDQCARLLAACYRYNEAIAQSRILVGEQRSALGPDHPDTLYTRGNLARWRGQAGDPAGAAAATAELLGDYMRVLGPDNPYTLADRGNLVHWRGQAGDPAAAARGYEELLADQLRVLGPDHPRTLGNRGNLAHWRGQAGDLAGAAAAAEDLLADQLRVLGPDHPDTLLTRGNLAHWRGQAGDLAGAAAAAEDLLADQLRVLGPDHPETLRTRDHLASWRAEAGDPAGAAAAAEDLLADQLRVLGPDHPETLRTRDHLASWRAEAGDPAGAAAAAEELLAGQLRVLGPDHPETLRTRIVVGHWRGMAGDPAGAAAAAEKLLADQLRVLGPDHPDILLTRRHLAFLRDKAGDPAGAAAAAAALLADQLRVLGPDHPDTLRTQNKLAFWRGMAGDPAGAAAAAEKLLADQLRVLGPDPPTPCAPRTNSPSGAVWRGTRREPLRRRRCSPASCGCSAPTSPTPKTFGPCSLTGAGSADPTAVRAMVAERGNDAAALLAKLS